LGYIKKQDIIRKNQSIAGVSGFSLAIEIILTAYVLPVVLAGLSQVSINYSNTFCFHEGYGQKNTFIRKN
jgi:hypothetical protein